MAAEPKMTAIQQDALDWCRARPDGFLHTEFRRAEITGPTIYSLIRRGLVVFDSVTCLYRASHVPKACDDCAGSGVAADFRSCPSCNGTGGVDSSKGGPHG
jgi:hypothetical protein